MSCHVPNSPREEAASAKKSLFKEIQRRRDTHTHTETHVHNPDVNLSNVEEEVEADEGVLHVKHI